MSTVHYDGDLVDIGETVAVPNHELTVRDGGRRVRLEWWHSDGVRARALFRVATDDCVAVLLSLSSWAVSQTPVAVPDWCNSLDHIPDGLLLAMRGAGYTPAEEIEEQSRPLTDFMEVSDR